MSDGVFNNQWLFVEDGASVRAVDEDFDVSTDPADTLPEAQPGPNRVTAWVPTEATLVNLGAPFPGSGSVPQIEAGITGRTENHVHLHTMGTGPKKGPVRSVVRLGIPTTTVHAVPPDLSLAELLATGTITQNPNANEVDSVFLEPHNVWNGYSMLTNGGAVHESRSNQIMVSGAGDVRLAGKRSVSIGSPGDVLVAVHKDEPVSDFIHNTGDQQSPSVAGPGKIHRELSTGFLAAEAAVNYFTGMLYTGMQQESGYNRAARPGVSGWQSIGGGDIFGTVLGYGIALSAPILFAVDKAMDTPGGRLDLFSSNSISMLGQTSVSMKSLVITSIGALVATTISGGALLSLSTAGMASFSGGLVGMSGMWKLDIESKAGPLTMRSRKSMDLSTREKLTVTANDEVQINSNDKEIWLFGKQGFYLACGGGEKLTPADRYTDVKYDNNGDGYGVAGTPTELNVGRFIHANVYGALGGNGDSACYMRLAPNETEHQLLRINNDRLLLVHKQNKIEMNDSGITITRGGVSFKVSDSEIRATGVSRIEFG